MGLSVNFSQTPLVEMSAVSETRKENEANTTNTNSLPENLNTQLPIYRRQSAVPLLIHWVHLSLSDPSCAIAEAKPGNNEETLKPLSKLQSCIFAVQKDCDHGCFRLNPFYIQHSWRQNMLLGP